MNVRPPAHVEPFVTALGVDRAVEFLLAFGGAPIYVAGVRFTQANRLVPVIGEDGVAALNREFGSRIDRVPVAKVWIARVWASRDVPVLEIARRLHTTDKTVRGWLKAGGVDPAAREAKRERDAAARARQLDIEDFLMGGEGRTPV